MTVVSDDIDRGKGLVGVGLLGSRSNMSCSIVGDGIGIGKHIRLVGTECELY
jgi:hypothetical protein